METVVEKKTKTKTKNDDTKDGDTKNGDTKRRKGKYDKYDFSGIKRMYPKKEEIEKIKMAPQLQHILINFHGKGVLTVQNVEDELKKMVAKGVLKTRQDPIRVFNYYRNTGALQDHGVTW